MTQLANQFTGPQMAAMMRVVIPWLQANRTLRISIESGSGPVTHTGKEWLDIIAANSGITEEKILRWENATAADMQHHDVEETGLLFVQLESQATADDRALFVTELKSKQKTLIYAAVGGVALIGLFAFLYFRGKKT